jgi:hypothetical protein
VATGTFSSSLNMWQPPCPFNDPPPSRDIYQQPQVKADSENVQPLRVHRSMLGL